MTRLGVHVPKFCGERNKSSGNTCMCLPKYHTDGVWTCGNHRPNKTKTNRPSPITPRFKPFECTICMEVCGSKHEEHITTCSHRFHNKCMGKWAQMGRSAVTCPLCRNVLQEVVTPPPSPTIENRQSSYLRMRVNMPEEVVTFVNMIDVRTDYGIEIFPTTWIQFLQCDNWVPSTNRLTLNEMTSMIGIATSAIIFTSP